jgi:hypothetical protein
MTRRILVAVGHALRPRASTPDVHFHRLGPAGEPVPCFDERCAMPHLDVG